MAKFDISFSISPEQLAENINSLAEDIEKPRRLMTKIGRYMEAKTKLNFDRQTDPFGKAWTPSLAAIREQRKTLIDTGTLQKSISFVADDDQVTVGTNVQYGKFHQLGTSKLPRRMFLGVGQQDIRVIDDIIDKEFEQMFKDNF